MNIDEQIEILQAIKAGKAVQWRPRVDPVDKQPWHDNTHHVGCNFAGFDYRVKPQIQTMVIWVNCYSVIPCGHSHPTREAADRHSGTDRIACKKIQFTFTPGEFDE